MRIPGTIYTPTRGSSQDGSWTPGLDEGRLIWVEGSLAPGFDLEMTTDAREAVKLDDIIVLEYKGKNLFYQVKAQVESQGSDYKTLTLKSVKSPMGDGEDQP